MKYLFDADGDVAARVTDSGVLERFDPDTWGWLEEGNRRDQITLRELADSDGFTVTVTVGPWEARVDTGPPHPRTRYEGFKKWSKGHAPPAYVTSDGGMGAYYVYKVRYQQP